jgi:xanthine/uracil permease
MKIAITAGSVFIGALGVFYSLLVNASLGVAMIVGAVVTLIGAATLSRVGYATDPADSKHFTDERFPVAAAIILVSLALGAIAGGVCLIRGTDSRLAILIGLMVGSMVLLILRWVFLRSMRERRGSTAFHP